MPTALALSPHLDDAAFSCGGTLARLARGGARVVVATLFTATVPDPTGFALACQLDKGLGPEIDYMALRRAEDLSALAHLGAETRHGPLREAPHRGYGSAPELFAAPRPDDPAGAELVPVLAALLAETGPDLLLAPQAIGGHVDHVALVEALTRLAPGLPILWWRDFPYTVRDARPKAPYAARFDALPALTVPLDAPARVARHAACAAYASQIGFQFGGADGLAARLAREEAETFAKDGALPTGLPL